MNITKKVAEEESTLFSSVPDPIIGELKIRDYRQLFVDSCASERYKNIFLDSNVLSSKSQIINNLVLIEKENCTSINKPMVSETNMHDSR